MDLQYMVHKYIHIAIILCVRELQLNFKVILVYEKRYNIVLYEMICCGHCDFLKRGWIGHIIQEVWQPIEFINMGHIGALYEMTAIVSHYTVLEINSLKWYQIFWACNFDHSVFQWNWCCVCDQWSWRNNRTVIQITSLK